MGKVRRLWELPQRWDGTWQSQLGTRFQRVFPSCKPQQWRAGQWDFGPGTEVPKHKSNAHQPEGAATQATQVAVAEQDSRTDEDRRIANVWGFPEIGVPPNHPFIDSDFPLQTIHLGVPPFTEITIYTIIYTIGKVPKIYRKLVAFDFETWKFSQAKPDMDGAAG